MRVLIVTAVEAEAKAIGEIDNAQIVVSGIGRTNAAAAVTEAVIRQGPFSAVLSAGVAGALPRVDAPLRRRGELQFAAGIADIVVASECIYAEEGLLTPDGFEDVQSLGFALGDFTGNTVPVDEHLLSALRDHFRAARIATVATCSGTHERALEIARRTGAVAEAMEGAAVVHAARRLGVPAIELRAISNTTGDRDRQQWDLLAALNALGDAIPNVLHAIRE